MHQKADGNESITKQDRNNINDPQKKPLWNAQLNTVLEDLNQFNGAPTSPLVQMWIKTHRCLVCMKDPKLIKASSPRTYKSITFPITGSNIDPAITPVPGTSLPGGGSNSEKFYLPLQQTLLRTYYL